MSRSGWGCPGRVGLTREARDIPNGQVVSSRLRDVPGRQVDSSVRGDVPCVEMSPGALGMTPPCRVIPTSVGMTRGSGCPERAGDDPRVSSHPHLMWG